MKPIVHIPHEVLVTPAKTVKEFDRRLLHLIEDMKETLLFAKNPKGVGLAAPQIGEPYRVFLTKPNAKSPIRVFINPEIIAHSPNKTQGVPERDNKLEGCLSIPKIWGTVHRFETLTLRFQDETGTWHTEEFSDFPATIVQHETDHINGILFTQRVVEQQEKLYETVRDSNGKETLEELTLR